MRNIDPASPENQQQSRENARYVGGLQLQEKSERQRDCDAINNMINHGGSFVRNLGRAAVHADPTNLAKLKSTFADIWEKYSQL